MNGIYVLVIRVDKDVNLEVGGLGNTIFVKGTYIYVGSAQRNLEKRVIRHLRKEKRLFWHIDYLLNNDAAKIEKVLCQVTPKSVECVLAQEISKHGEETRGFGCSDCKCKSHLFRVREYDFLLDKMKPLICET